MTIPGGNRGKNSMIVLAAGMGKRMGAKKPKMLLPLLGRPLLYWSLKNLENCDAVHSIVLTAPRSHRNFFQRKIKEWGFRKVTRVVDGGKERQDSTLNASQALPKETEWVGIHDGARALVSPSLVKKCFNSAKKYGAAILAVPSKDTVKIADNTGGEALSCFSKKFVKRTIPRKICWSAQTPQVFHLSLLRKMQKFLSARRNSSKSLYTDDASIAEELGHKVCLVPSSYENIKVTTPEDLTLAEAILRK